ncbi:hypothetical protein HYPSUDRAFT_43416 [Hypholoma sublateritium FD-334 SS-4]|uniref:Uncharacterized protein n=1 Tax=Hypholoma sublateritium (strain FD-334 SS-4) TaxID=945553 RepID=A0A0D2PJZ1_HYPSF|nr:hypothetical protein HYPSUDRAFT_43416 [Hypholoma sublateritium FD-334 SS-4]
MISQLRICRFKSSTQKPLPIQALPPHTYAHPAARTANLRTAPHRIARLRAGPHPSPYLPTYH